jgi:uncharacterized protein (DUF488 family)
MKIYTIGYGGRSPADFTASLVAAGVRCIADVRAFPERSSMGSYVRAKSPEKGIEGLLARAGIAYRWLPELGNEWRHEDGWEEKYRARLESEGERRTQGLFELDSPFCLLCAEKDPGRCHRAIVAAYLERARDDVEIEHL